MDSTQSAPPRPAGSPSPPSRPSLTQIVASALAAVSAAVISSTFGVAGTLIGAAVASTVASVGSTLYVASMRRTNQRLRQLAAAARRTDWSSVAAGGLTQRDLQARLDALPGDPSDVPDDAPADLPPGVARPSLRERLRWRALRRGLPGLRRRWIAVAGLAMVAFAVSIGVILALEASTGKPVSALVGGPKGAGLIVHNPAAASPKPTSTPSPSSTQTPSATPSATKSPSQTPSPSPAATPSGGVGSPAPPSPSPNPSLGLPSPSPPAPATTP